MKPTIQDLWRSEAKYYEELFDPELKKLQGTIEINAWHDHDDVYIHTLAVYEELLNALRFTFIKNKKRKQQLESYLGENFLPHGLSFCSVLLTAALFHDIAKPQTISTDPATGQTLCKDHEIIGARVAGITLAIFTDYQPRSIAQVQGIISSHSIPHDVFAPGAQLANRVRKFLEDYRSTAIELALLGYADTKGCQLNKLNPPEFQFRIDAYQAFFNDSALDKLFQVRHH